MKTVLSALAMLLFTAGIANADDDSYAIAAYGEISTETVIVYGPIESCDAAFLVDLRDAIKPTIAPSLAEIGYACASHDQIVRLSLVPPVCEIQSSDTTAVPTWIYVCYRGRVDRFVAQRPPPNAAESEQKRKVNEASQAAQRQAAELAAKREAERMAWQGYAVEWKHQRDKAACLQRLNPHGAPVPDDPAALCDHAATNSAEGNPTQAVIQYCAYMRSAGQPENAIRAACDTKADRPYNIMPPDGGTNVSPIAETTPNPVMAIQAKPASRPKPLQMGNDPTLAPDALPATPATSAAVIPTHEEIVNRCLDNLRSTGRYKDADGQKYMYAACATMAK